MGTDVDGLRAATEFKSVFICVHLWLKNPQFVHHHAAAYARERAGVADAFSSRGRDGEI